MEILQDWKLKYQILESKYKELLSDHKNLQKNHEEMLKGKREDLVQIENLKAENEALKKQVNVDTLTEQPNIKISDFAKTIFSRMPEMIKTLSIFSQRIEVVETEPEIRSSVRMSGKPPQARPDHGIQFECTDPGIYEAFFIIGASKTSNIPSILFEYPFENSSIATAAKRVLPEFCFPSSIEVKELNNRCSSSELNKILYGQSPHRSRSTYVFTIRSEELLDEFNT